VTLINKSIQRGEFWRKKEIENSGMGDNLQIFAGEEAFHERKASPRGWRGEKK